MKHFERETRFLDAHLCAPVPNNPRNTRQRGKLIRCRLRKRPSELIQQRRFPNRRKANQTDAAVARLCHVEPFAFRSTLRCRLHDVPSELGQLRLKRPKVRRRGFVLLRSAHFELDGRNLLEYIRHDC